MENVKRVFVILMAAVALCASGQTDRPKLIVGLVVDQMRWDYLYNYQWGEGGFKTLLQEGYRCNNTIIDYVPTVTAAGHATIYSGTTPAFHGIAGNNFMLNGKNVTSVQDDSERGVGGNDKTRGKSPRNLITTNLADQLLLATDFKSRTVGIALKDRAAILPAGHRPIGAYWYDKGSASFVTSTYYRDKLPKWVSDFNKKHHDEIASDVYNLPIGTTLTFALAEQALINEQLGQGEATDLLAISVSNTDMCSHYYGTHSPKVDSIYYQLDREIAHFIEVLDQRIGRGNYLLFLSADHGGTHSYPRMTSHGLPSACWYNPEALTAANQVLKQQFGVDSLLKAEMEYTFYLNQEVIDGARLDRDQVMRAACQALEQPEEIQWAIDVSRIDTYPIPSILKERIKLGYFPERSGEIYIVPRTGVYAGKTEWDGSNHGTWSQSDSHIPLIFMGWHIPAGETNRLTHMTDIAATICAMLHIQSPNGCIGMPIFE
ncbi:MAG: alkaline phosphatase family protein [Muribaculaceae bacterium]|nr:alkaline phosphatase family protein [Muribaculaceae bacterium]